MQTSHSLIYEPINTAHSLSTLSTLSENSQLTLLVNENLLEL